MRVTMIVERATTTTNGLGERISTWEPDGTVNVTLAPAGASVKSAAAVRGVKVTHTALAGKGFQVDPLDTRLSLNGLRYTIHAVTITNRGSILELEGARPA